MNLIEFKNISKTFYKRDETEHTVLSDINFSVKKGECFTIIGPNGSGKTTLLRIIGLIEKPTRGKMFYLGEDITDLSKKEILLYRRKFSFVRQKPVVLNATVANNIAYGLKVRGVERDQIISKVTEIIELVSLRGLANKNARSLSGGEMQRVAIAMNFILSPELYLLDEVSANLDLQNIVLLDKFITKIKQDKEKTIILSTHDPLEAIKYGDQIAVLNEGKISQIGTPDEIFTSPVDEFTAQFVGYENIFEGVAKFDPESGLNKIKINNLTIAASTQKEGKLKVCIRPESIVIAKNPPTGTSFRNSLKGKVDSIRELGNICHIFVLCESEKFLITITKQALTNLDLKPQTEVFISFKATDVKCL
ncbi:MAG: ABC transporter ATP-binding protein [Candidatus Hodarchaeota archaeon]